MHFPDLEICTYGRNAKAPEAWRVPLLAIGWLEAGMEYNQGEQSREFIDLARQYREETWYRLSGYRGLHGCTLCPSGPATKGIEGSHINLFVPGKECVYMASGGLVHYMEEHSYSPPEEFVSALLSSPLPSDKAYDDKLIASNKGERPLLLWTLEERMARPRKKRKATPDTAKERLKRDTPESFD